jgi:hypothetical protein
MIKPSHLPGIVALSLIATACSGEKDAPEADNVTETKMDEVDVIDGTISDDMVDVDTQATGDVMEEDAADGDKEGAAEAKSDSE